MASIPKGPDAFFRLSPSDIGKAQCFAVQWGSAKGTRCDIDFHHPGFRELLGRISKLSHTVTIAEIVAVPFASGFAAGKGDRAQSQENSALQIRPTQILPDGELDMTDAYGIRVGDISVGDYLQDGEVLFNNTNSTAWVGKSAVFHGTVPTVCSNHVTRLRLRKGIEPEFVALVLNMLQRLRYFARLCTNFNNQAGVNTDALATVRVPFPPPLLREKLVAAMDAARVVRQGKLAEADALLAGLDDYLLATLGLTPPPRDGRKVFAVQVYSLGKRVDPYSNQSRFKKLFAHIRASKYRVATFKELATRIFSGVTPLAKGDAYVSPPDGVRFIRSGEITADGEVNPTSEVHLSATIHNGMMKRSQLESGDLLIAIVGATIGAAGVFNHDEPANINQAIAAVRLIGDGISPGFACLYLRSSIGQALLDYFKRPVARANINLEEIGDIPLVIPPKDVQENIVVESHRRREEARRLRAEADSGWQAAKHWFEEQLLGPAQP